MKHEQVKYCLHCGLFCHCPDALSLTWCSRFISDKVDFAFLKINGKTIIRPLEQVPSNSPF